MAATLGWSWRARHVSPLPARGVASTGGIATRGSVRLGSQAKVAPNRVIAAAILPPWQHMVTPRSGSKLTTMHTSPSDTEARGHLAGRLCSHEHCTKTSVPDGRRDGSRSGSRPALFEPWARKSASAACTSKSRLRDKRQDSYHQANAPGEVPGGRLDGLTVTRPGCSGLISLCGVWIPAGISRTALKGLTQ